MLGGRGCQAGHEDELAHILNRQSGFVFQQFNLLPALPPGATSEYPLANAGRSEGRARSEERGVRAKRPFVVRRKAAAEEVVGGGVRKSGSRVP